MVEMNLFAEFKKAASILLLSSKKLWVETEIYYYVLAASNFVVDGTRFLHHSCSFYRSYGELCLLYSYFPSISNLPREEAMQRRWRSDGVPLLLISPYVMISK
jgi:hypothetical protein